MSTEKWEPELGIPLSDLLFVRVHENNVNNKGNEIGLPRASAFYNTPKNGPDLSSDWSKYTTPSGTHCQIGKEYRTGTQEFKNPEKFFIISFLIDDIIKLNLDQRVEHTPRQENFPDELTGFPWNRAHCSIVGNDEERRLKMIDIAKWEIAPSIYNPKNDERTFRH